jgi:hypothetical protein
MIRNIVAGGPHPWCDAAKSYRLHSDYQCHWLIGLRYHLGRCDAKRMAQAFINLPRYPQGKKCP